MDNETLNECHAALENFDKVFFHNSVTLTAQTRLEQEISMWLYENKSLPKEQKIEKVKGMLEKLDREALIAHAVQSSINLGLMLQMFDIAMNAANGMAGIKDHANELIKTYTAKCNNKVRVTKYAATESLLFDYWKKNINSSKLATDAAILLERTDISKQAQPQPKRSTLENYVRKWQSLPDE